MATFSSVTRQHVLAAIAEHDSRGPQEFCARYGFTPGSGASLTHEGRTYDAAAILGVAHREATGRLATPEEVRSGLTAALGILTRRGFSTSGPAAARAVQPRVRTAPRAPRRTPSARDVAPSVCPTCSMTLPATGVCDDCG